jgi:hypothetical protein
MLISIYINVHKPAHSVVILKTFYIKKGQNVLIWRRLYSDFFYDCSSFPSLRIWESKFWIQFMSAPLP